MDALSQLFTSLNIRTKVFHNAVQCGRWRLDEPAFEQVLFHCITHGQGRIEAPEHSLRHQLRAGDCVFVRPGVRHALQADVDDTDNFDPTQHLRSDGCIRAPDDVGMMCGQLAYDGVLAAPFLAGWTPLLVLRGSRQPLAVHLQPLMQLLLAESAQPTRGSELVLNRLGDILMMQVFRHLQQATQTDDNTLQAFVDKRLRGALTALYLEPEREWQLDDLAQRAHMSRSAFAEQFRSQVGQSPLEYVRMVRMQRAWRYLRESQETIQHIALQCGYQSESSFSKAFQKIFGCRPGQLRTQFGRQDSRTGATDIREGLPAP
jgi:AraC-like DNA-binding protein